MLGDGRNRVPTIHIIDLARIVKRVVFKDSAQQYIFAIDKTKRPTQKRLIKAVASGIGTGQIEKVAESDYDSKWDSWAKFLTINLKMKTSDAFKDGELPEDHGMEEEEAEKATEELKFPWHAEEGMTEKVIM